tara:strand:- start:1045 stop:1704 length:660 start_codon:yes stop_codon:yes gene_type:complete
MALSTYGGLKTAVADWSYNGGGVTAALVGTDFFPQVQSMLYRGHGTDIDPLRITAMFDSATITPASGGIITISSQVSSGFLEFIELTPTSSGAISINYVPPWDFRKNASAIASTTAPQYIYTIEGDSLYVAPASVQPIAAKWYEKFTALSADGDTDWIILNAPQVYLDGCLMLACAYTQDDREAAFRAKFAAGIKGLNLHDQRARSSGSVKVSRPRVVV